MTAPRLFGIPARDSPVVAVLRRGPSDWSADGRLLVATVDGRLQVRDGSTVSGEVDLAALTPDPRPPPTLATRW